MCAGLKSLSRSERGRIVFASSPAKLTRSTPTHIKMTAPSLDYYGIEVLLTEEERAARDRARRFVQEEVLSEIVPCHRAGKFPEHLTPHMGSSCKSSSARIRACARWRRYKVRSQYRPSILLARRSNKRVGCQDWF